MKEIKKYSIAIVITFLSVEIISIIILTILGIGPLQDPNYSSYRSSGYYCFSNKPNQEFISYNSDENNKFTISNESLKTDAFGFISSSEIKMIKPKNVIRIFLRGGSTMFGSLQTDFVNVTPLYPRGNYSFSSSIAGLLEKKLQSKLPNKKIEVINASVVQHSFYQNLSMYNSLLHLFNPDVIVSMDGFNDIESVEMGDFYKYQEKISSNFIKMEAQMQSKHFPFSLFLMNYSVTKISKRKTVSVSDNKAHKIEYLKRNILQRNSSDEKKYRLNKDKFLKNSKDLFWIIDTYSSILTKNNVYPIVCIQPILKRQDVQKSLTPYEKKLHKFLSNKLNDDLVNKYFWGLDFCPIADSIVKKNGGEFIDFGKIIAEKTNQNQEVYLDYCHLTYFANKIIADTLSKSIIQYLDSKK